MLLPDHRLAARCPASRPAATPQVASHSPTGARRCPASCAPPRAARTRARPRAARTPCARAASAGAPARSGSTSWPPTRRERGPSCARSTTQPSRPPPSGGPAKRSQAEETGGAAGRPAEGALAPFWLQWLRLRPDPVRTPRARMAGLRDDDPRAVGMRSHWFRGAEGRYASRVLGSGENRDRSERESVSACSRVLGDVIT